MKIKSLVLGLVAVAMFSCSKPSFDVNVATREKAPSHLKQRLKSTVSKAAE